MVVCMKIWAGEGKPLNTEVKTVRSIVRQKIWTGVKNLLQDRRYKQYD